MIKAKKNNVILKSNVSIEDYAQTLADLKKKIQEAQTRAIFSVNKELIKLYWEIGQTLDEKQKVSKWGSNIIEGLAKDLQNEFPGIAGFSRTNIFRMKAFYLAYEKVPQAVGLIYDLPIFRVPWGHNAVLLDKVKNIQERLWYAQKAIENGWTRIALETYIESKLYSREGKAITNFERILPNPDSRMAQQSFKDPYKFDFLTLEVEHVEHELEQGLVDNIQKLLIEMGKGFAFVGRQYHLAIGNKDCYIDLLFYHLKLKCYVVVELKAREFDPKDAGQINFYLSAVDDLLRQPEDKPTIGLILCKSKDNLIAEYALRDINKPIGIADYEPELITKLPKDLKNNLPTVAEIEAEFEKKQALASIEKKQLKKKLKTIKSQ